MENPTWARMIIVGLILAILAAGYFLLTGGFVKSKPNVASSTIQTTTITPTQAPIASGTTGTRAVITATPSPTPTPKPATTAYNTLVQRNQQAQGTTTTQAPAALPNTGFPIGPVALLALSVVVTGWGLRKFPN